MGVAIKWQNQDNNDDREESIKNNGIYIGFLVRTIEIMHSQNMNRLLCTGQHKDSVTGRALNHP